MKITMTIEADSATDLQNTVLALADFCSITAPESTESIPYKGVETQKEAPKAEPAAENPKTVSVTKEQVRDRLSALPKEKVKALWAHFGVKQLSDIPAEKYPELMEKAQ